MARSLSFHTNSVNESRIKNEYVKAVFLRAVSEVTARIFFAYSHGLTSSSAVTFP